MEGLNWFADITCDDVIRRTVVEEREDDFVDLATGEILLPESVKLDHPASQDEADECVWRAQGVK